MAAIARNWSEEKKTHFFKRNWLYFTFMNVLENVALLCIFFIPFASFIFHTLCISLFLSGQYIVYKSSYCKKSPFSDCSHLEFNGTWNYTSYFHLEFQHSWTRLIIPLLLLASNPPASPSKIKLNMSLIHLLYTWYPSGSYSDQKTY